NLVKHASPQRTATAEKRSRIATIFTGGTIAVSADSPASVVPALSGREILDRVPELAKALPAVDVHVHDFATLPGPHISPETMRTLAGFIRAIMDNRPSEEPMDGFVVTHGTDSLEETAYFLDLVAGTRAPIVITGSMHTSTDAAWDGGRNLVDAIAVAASREFHGVGALVVMNGEIHAASEVTKTHTMDPGTFRSLDFGPIGKVNTLARIEPIKTRDPKSRTQIALTEEAGLPYVELLKTYSGMDDRLFIASLKEGARGIVVEAMGQGNVPPGVAKGIARAREMNVPVVITSRCPSGPVRPYYAYEGAGQELEGLGCIFAPYLNGPKARLKLMVALAANALEQAFSATIAVRPAATS
ncbi:MAG: asparaginase, partial [Acidobacteriaceae bacterium]